MLYKYFNTKTLWIIIGVLLLVVVIGSFYWYQALKETEQITKQINNGNDASSEHDKSNWNTYVNVKYGYQFSYPKNYIIYQKYPEEGVEVVYPDGYSDYVAVAQKIIFGGESETFSVEVRRESVDLKTVAEIFSTEGEIIYSRETSFNGMEAWEMKGTATISSADKVLVFRKEALHYIILMYTADEGKFDDILSTFKLI